MAGVNTVEVELALDTTQFDVKLAEAEQRAFRLLVLDLNRRVREMDDRIAEFDRYVEEINDIVGKGTDEIKEAVLELIRKDAYTSVRKDSDERIGG